MYAPSARSTLAVVGSGLLHVLFLVASPAPPLQPRVRTRQRVSSFDLTVLPLPSQDMTVRVEPPPSPALVQRPRVAPRARPSSHATVIPTQQTAMAATNATAAPLPTSAAANGTPAPRSLDLSATAAARTLTGERPGAWSVSVDRTNAPPQPHSLRALAEGMPGVTTRSEDNAPAHFVNDKVGLLLRPWQHWLEPVGKGRFRYRGTGFDAVIRDDGSVDYRSKDGPMLGAGSSTNQEGTAGDPTFGIGFGDFAVWSEKHAGNDPHQVERRRFLDGTRVLREELYTRELERVHAAADVQLARTLRQIQRLGALSKRARQDALLGVWDECADDEVGALARRQIERFVREHCAEVCDFASADLQRINASRTGLRVFEPYRADED